MIRWACCSHPATSAMVGGPDIGSSGYRQHRDAEVAASPAMESATLATSMRDLVRSRSVGSTTTTSGSASGDVPSWVKQRIDAAAVISNLGGRLERTVSFLACPTESEHAFPSGGENDPQHEKTMPPGPLGGPALSNPRRRCQSSSGSPKKWAWRCGRFGFGPPVICASRGRDSGDGRPLFLYTLHAAIICSGRKEPEWTSNRSTSPLLS
jgi:hypothetical protein